MRELPRKLTADELADLFEGRTSLVERLSELENPLERAEDVLVALSDDEKREALDAHPAIGQRSGLSERSAAEQGDDVEPAVLDELERLNRDYEARFGFRFVVFVDGRSKPEILDVLRMRMARTTDEELDTGCRELVAIARNRWTRT